jgi:DNA polymerase III delta prime subunit
METKKENYKGLEDYTPAEFDAYINQTAQDMKKELNLDDNARFLDFDVIEQEIYFYIDETTGARIYDAELMLSEFQDKLNQLTKGTI